jgi:hypothetical protein
MSKTLREMLADLTRLGFKPQQLSALAYADVARHWLEYRHLVGSNVVLLRPQLAQI